MSVLGNDGRVTIPKSIRGQLRLHPGDRIEFEVVNGRLVGRVRLPTDVMALHRRLPGVDAELINLDAEERAFADAAVEKYADGNS